jgi:hypothetical protein
MPTVANMPTVSAANASNQLVSREISVRMAQETLRFTQLRGQQVQQMLESTRRMQRVLNSRPLMGRRLNILA